LSVRLVWLVIVVLSVATCGQKGPLELPDQKQTDAHASLAPSASHNRI